MPIRDAVLSDTPVIEKLLNQLGYPDTGIFLESRVKEMMQSSSEKLLVYEDENGHAIGFMSLHFMPRIALAGDFMQIVYFAIDETVRSKGVGAQMEAYATLLARERNCSAIELHCNERRKDAHRFYERQGYEESPKYYIKKLS